MKARALVGLLLLAGCDGGLSFISNDDQPEVPLIGAAPPTGSLPRLNKSSASAMGIVTGADGSFWVEFTETVDAPDGGRVEGIRAVRLSEPVAEEVLIADDLIATFKVFYLVDHPRDGTTASKVTYRTVGDTKPSDVFELPPGPGIFYPTGGDDGFFYFAINKDTKDFLLQRRDRSFQRRLPVPEGVDPSDPTKTARFWFSYDGQWLFVRDGKGKLVQHATTKEVDFELGMRPGILIEYRGQLVACGMDGLHAVALDGSGTEKLIDPEPCGAVTQLSRGRIVYVVGGEIRRAPLDASTPFELILSADKRMIRFGPKDEVLFSRDPADRYVHGVGDGWLGNWRFMDRGRDVQYSADATRLRWLEHAAQQSGVGDLYSASALGSPPTVLALNVREYEELDDKRILANSNRAFRGIQNRLIVIDEEKRVAKWVADQSNGYNHVPGSDDLLVERVNGDANGFDVVRVPMPPKD